VEHFKKLLQEHHDWPCRYQFKFVVTAEREQDVRALLPDAEISVRPSRNGKFVSVTMIALLQSPDEVVEVHTRASAIDGLIAL
jgi:hypothetical protein